MLPLFHQTIKIKLLLKPKRYQQDLLSIYPGWKGIWTWTVHSGTPF